MYSTRCGGCCHRGGCGYLADVVIRSRAGYVSPLIDSPEQPRDQAHAVVIRLAGSEVIPRVFSEDDLAGALPFPHKIRVGALFLGTEPSSTGFKQ